MVGHNFQKNGRLVPTPITHFVCFKSGKPFVDVVHRFLKSFKGQKTSKFWCDKKAFDFDREYLWNA